jgi:hypothetical protein
MMLSYVMRTELYFFISNLVFRVGTRGSLALPIQKQPATCHGITRTVQTLIPNTGIASHGREENTKAS